MRVVYHLARADFLERVRRYSFLLILAFAAGLAFLTYTGGITLQLDRYRGIYNSAWVGSMMTVVCTAFITLAGFYMVKNAIERDGQTRVGLVLASTSMSKSAYTLGKALSNFAVLSAMVAVLAVAAVVLQLVRAEGYPFEPGKLLAPFVWVALPAMAMTAAVAVVFETLPVLRGGIGNVIYFFAWGAYIGFSGVQGLNDYLGLGFFMRDMAGRLKSIDPTYPGGFALQVGPIQHATKTFVWQGIAWTPQVLLGRLQWVAIAAGIAWLAAAFFHRFDPARERRHLKRKPEAPALSGGEVSADAPRPSIEAIRLTPLGSPARGPRLAHLVIAELRLMLKGHSWWWYAIAAALFVASLAVPDDAARRIIASFAWLWPILIWSQMGSRDSRCDTRKLLFSCAHTLGRRLPAMWIAGVIVAMAAGGGLGIHLLISSDWMRFAAWLAGALFVPTLALALGVWSGTSKLFEAVYMLWWYVGPMNHVPGLDFTGMAPAQFSTPIYLLATVALLMAAYAGRRSQLGYA